VAQRVLKVDEMMLPQPMEGWHAYELEWLEDGACFVVDGKVLLQTRFAPRGPLGFVAWMDNQYMITIPQGRFGHGALTTGKQWMEVRSLEVSKG
jgi:hypothetical protein